MVLRGLNCNECRFFGQFCPFLVFDLVCLRFFHAGPCLGAAGPPRLCMYPCIARPRQGLHAYALSGALTLALLLVFLRIDSPVSVKRWLFCINRSSIASAIVASPIHLCQCSMGS